MFYLKKNLDRDIKDISLFEIGPAFYGNKPGQQEIVIGALRSGLVSRLNWIEKERKLDIFDAKRDAIQSLVEIGLDQNKFKMWNKNMIQIKNFDALNILSSTAERLSKGEILQIEKVMKKEMNQDNPAS